MFLSVILPDTLDPGLDVWDEDGKPVPHDGKTTGEIVIKGNCVMTGYLNNPEANATAFKGGWSPRGLLF